MFSIYIGITSAKVLLTFLMRKYEKEYFSEEYKKQYGKTYLEDFDSIKETCYRRLNEINNVLRVPNRSNPKISAGSPIQKASDSQNRL